MYADIRVSPRKGNFLTQLKQEKLSPRICGMIYKREVSFRQLYALQMGPRSSTFDAAAARDLGDLEVLKWYPVRFGGAVGVPSSLSTVGGCR